jgi:hypothetical protein
MDNLEGRKWVIDSFEVGKGVQYLL